MLIGVHRRSSAAHEWLSCGLGCGSALAVRGLSVGAADGLPRGHAAGGLPHHGGGQERAPGHHPGAGRLHGLRKRRTAADQNFPPRRRSGFHRADHRQQRQHAGQARQGFTMASVMLAAGRSRPTALYSAVGLAAATLLGVLVIEVVPTWLSYGLPISAGVAIYVGATDLVPEVNREPGIRMALVFFAGVGAFLLLRLLLPAV